MEGGQAIGRSAEDCWVGLSLESWCSGRAYSGDQMSHPHWAATSTGLGASQLRSDSVPRLFNINWG